MLDHGISLRCMLMWVTWVVAVALGAAGWVGQSENLGRLGLASVCLGCTFMLMNDNAKTRRCLRALSRAHDLEQPKISRVT